MRHDGTGLFEGFRARCRHARITRSLWSASRCRRTWRFSPCRPKIHRDSCAAPSQAPGLGRPVSPRVDPDDGRKGHPPELSLARRMRRGRWVLALAILAAPRAGAQQSLRIDGPDHAEATFLLRTAAGGPHDLIVADSSRRLTFPRGTTLPRTTIIVGGDASVAATVHGDFIVVGGDLFIQPGATIRGKAIAIGGGVYGSTLALVSGGTHSIRDRTFIASRTPEGFSSIINDSALVIRPLSSHWSVDSVYRPTTESTAPASRGDRCCVQPHVSSSIPPSRTGRTSAPGTPASTCSSMQARPGA